MSVFLPVSPQGEEDWNFDCSPPHVALLMLGQGEAKSFHSRWLTLTRPRLYWQDPRVRCCSARRAARRWYSGCTHGRKPWPQRNTPESRHYFSGYVVEWSERGNCRAMMFCRCYLILLDLWNVPECLPFSYQTNQSINRSGFSLCINWVTLILRFYLFTYKAMYPTLANLALAS